MVPAEYAEAFRRAGELYPQVPPAVLYGVITQESGWNPRAYNPRTGARGLGQFMPETARGLRIDPNDPTQSIIGTAQYLSQLIAQFGGSVVHGIAAYNTGPGNLLAFGLDGVLAPDYAGGETRTFLQNVSEYASQFGGEGGASVPGGNGSSNGANVPSGNRTGCVPGMAGVMTLVMMVTQLCR